MFCWAGDSIGVEWPVGDQGTSTTREYYGLPEKNNHSLKHCAFMQAK